MASNKANTDWWTETPKDLILHDQIWYNAIRALVSVESRSDLRIADTALDQLIREGLINRDEKEVSFAMQQWLRYPAILVDHLANSQGVLVEEESGRVGESKYPLGGQGEGLRDGKLTPSLSSF